ncbi:MAG: hypothetical protein ABFD25_12215 [Clostridiaceae bacterium]
MKRRKRPFVLLCAMLAAMLLLNMAVMYVFFDINLLHLQELLRESDESGRAGNGGSAAGSEAGAGSKTQADSEAGAGSKTQADGEAQTGADSESNSQRPGSEGTGYFMTRAQVASLEHLSLEDKLVAMDIVSKIGMSEAKRIYDMSLDGITQEEYAEVKRSVGGKLSESDIQAIEKLLNRSLFASQSEPDGN